MARNGAKEYTLHALYRFNRMHIRRVLPHNISFGRMGRGEETLGWRPKLLVNHDHELVGSRQRASTSSLLTIYLVVILLDGSSQDLLLTSDPFAPNGIQTGTNVTL